MCLVKVLPVFRKAIDIALPLWFVYLNRLSFLTKELIVLLFSQNKFLQKVCIELTLYNRGC